VLELDRPDEVIATIAPTALGSGPALFDGRRRLCRLEVGSDVVISSVWGADAPL
jgi:hypothetical protein